MHQQIHGLRPHVPLALLLLFFLWTSFYGINFGVHWDENRSKFDSVKNSLETGMFIQAKPDPDLKDVTYYTYGGVNYLLTWAGFAPEIWDYLRAGKWTRQALSDTITPVIYTVSSHVRVRGIYIVLCSLSMVWMYCLNLVLGRSRREAFLAAAILAGSWEFAYHSRWIAPDVLMMQFALLSFLCLAVGRARRRVHWFYLSAVAAGLAAGTKYPGGLTVFFLVAGAGHTLWQETRSFMAVLKHSIGIGAAAFATFVLTTPGVLLDPFSFFGQIQYLRASYAASHYGYTVTPGLSHFFKILRYFALELFSNYPALSAVFAIFCLTGFIALTLERRLFNFLFIAFTLVYVGYFSQQGELVVRNLFVVVPFLILASARGIMVLARPLGKHPRTVLAAAIGIALAVNFAWEVYAAHQIKKRNNSAYFLRQFVSYAARRPADTFLISAKLSNALHELSQPIPDNVVTDPDNSHSKIAFFQSEGPDVLWEQWPANWWGMYETTFGALEVNLDAYPTFVGNQRILLTTAEHFERLPLKTKDMLTP